MRKSSFYGIVASTMLTISCVMTGPAFGESLYAIAINAAPFNYSPPGATPATEPVGVFPEIVKALSERTGHQIKVGVVPFARLNNDLLDATADFTISIWSPTREGKVQRGEPALNMDFGVIARKGVTLNSYADLAPLRISTIRGLSMPGSQFDSDSALHKEEDTDYSTAIRKLASGKVDAVAGALPPLVFLAKNEKAADLIGTPLVLSSLPVEIQFSKKSAHIGLLPDFEKAIKDLKADGTIGKITAKHF